MTPPVLSVKYNIYSDLKPSFLFKFCGEVAAHLKPMLDSFLYFFKKEKTPKNGVIANAEIIF